MFGMKWPLRHGWAKEMIGRQVTDDFLPKLASLKKPARAFSVQSPKPLLIRSCEFTDDAGNPMVHVQYDLTDKDAKKLADFIRSLS